MPIPTFDEFLWPFLALLNERGDLSIQTIRQHLATHARLTPDEIAARLPSGASTVIANRVGWARTYLFKAGLIDRVARDVFTITDAGRAALQAHPQELRLADLKKIPQLKEWLTTSSRADADPEHIEQSVTPIVTTIESLEQSERMLRTLVEEDVLRRVTNMEPSRFEWLVEELVVKLGFGSSASAVRHALQRGGADGGVDGVINEDRLGLGQIFLQAKCYAANNTVGRPTIQAFVGAMHGSAQKGVFITTSSFSKEARDYAGSLQGLRIRLVDGRELASLMVDCGLGVNEERAFRTYRVDGDFFEDAD